MLRVWWVPVLGALVLVRRAQALPDCSAGYQPAQQSQPQAQTQPEPKTRSWSQSLKRWLTDEYEVRKRSRARSPEVQRTFLDRFVCATALFDSPSLPSLPTKPPVTKWKDGPAPGHKPPNATTATAMTWLCFGDERARSA